MLDEPILDLFVHHARYSTPRTQLFLAKVYRDGEFLGLAPVVRLAKRPFSDTLHPRRRRWMGPTLGRLIKKTTYFVDTAFLAYSWRSPFFLVDPANEEAVRNAVSDHLQSKPDADNVWIMLTEADADWAMRRGYAAFRIIPMVHVKTGGFASMDDYVHSLSKKRRKNFRVDQAAWEKAGAALEVLEAPIAPEIIDAMHRLLCASAKRSTFVVPYEDVMIDKTALAEQEQAVLLARVAGQVVGFMSFIANGSSFQQCHGGFDYKQSLDGKAYHNLIYYAIDHAIRHGFDQLTMGPLNNETKRRTGTALMPVAAGLWCRSPLDTFLTRKRLIPKFQVYTGAI